MSKLTVRTVSREDSEKVFAAINRNYKPQGSGVPSLIADSAREYLVHDIALELAEGTQTLRQSLVLAKMVAVLTDKRSYLSIAGMIAPLSDLARRLNVTAFQNPALEEVFVALRFVEVK